MKPQLSILMAGFRRENWKKVYDSTVNSVCGLDFELVIVSPHDSLPDELKDKPNISHYQDWGSPSRAAQIAAINAKSDILFYLISDDGVFLPEMLKEGYDIFTNLEYNPKNILIMMYAEGINGRPKYMHSMAYYTLNFHKASKLHCVPDHWLGMNQVFLYKDYFCELGGFDCSFEVAPIAMVDFAVRSQKNKASVHFMNMLVADYGWEPRNSGGHNLIWEAQTLSDEPKLQEKYKNGFDCVSIKIPLENYKLAPAKWPRRWNKV